jgi:DNA polymerase-3 subunit epsilon
MEPNDQTPVEDSPAAVSPPSYVGFDLETTGIDYFSDLPVSYGFVERVFNGTEMVVRAKRGYVNPGITIPEAVTAIHGITDDMVASAPELAATTEKIASLLASIWQSGGVVVGMNVSYDLTMVESLCMRLGLTPLSQRGEIGAVFDILVIDRRFDKYRKGGRKLTDLCAHYGVVLGDAHDASADAGASLEVLEAMIARFPELATIPTESISETMRTWYQTWLRDFSAYREKQGDAPANAGRYIWPIHTAE